MIKTLILIILLSNNLTAFTQAIGIGTTAPETSAILEIKSTDKGFLVPRTDTATVNAAHNPAKALLIYQNSDSMFYYYDGAKWRGLNSKSSVNISGIIQLNKILFTKRIYGTGGNPDTYEIYTANYDGTNKQMIPVPTPPGYRSPYNARLSPDGLFVFFEVTSLATNSNGIFRCDINGANLIQVAESTPTESTLRHVY